MCFQFIFSSIVNVPESYLYILLFIHLFIYLLDLLLFIHLFIYLLDTLCASVTVLPSHLPRIHITSFFFFFSKWNCSLLIRHVCLLLRASFKRFLLPSQAEFSSTISNTWHFLRPTLDPTSSHFSSENFTSMLSHLFRFLIYNSSNLVSYINSVLP